MKYAYIITPFLLCFSIFNVGYSQSNNYQLVWVDDFNSKKLNDKFWSFENGDGCPNICGWGNNELEYYTDNQDNARIENGILIIEAHRQKKENKDYTSSKLITKNKLDWQYGKLEISARLPSGLGTWPAFWMLPTLDRPLKWPLDGEIDIMEHVGYNHGMIFGTIHTEKYNHLKGTQKSDSIRVVDVSEKFHVYGIEWTENEITWFVDGMEYNKVNIGTDDEKGWPFNQNKFYLILNLAIGGNWAGKMGVPEDIWPQRLEIDYVKYYKKIEK